MKRIKYIVVLTFILTFIPLPSPFELIQTNSYIKNDFEAIEKTIIKKLSLNNAPPLYVNIIWHQHQPVYKNPLNNLYELPWVYMHAIKDYRYMVEIIPTDINVTINLTGSLLQQLLDYVSYSTKGIKDKRIELALMNESSMTYDDKEEIWNTFFDINSQFIKNRYLELQQKKNLSPNIEAGISSFTDQDWRDLKGLFFFWWINFDYVDNDATLTKLKTYYTLPTSDSSYIPWTHDNISYVIDFGFNITQDVIPYHKSTQDSGNLEIITSPLNHPILPLLINSTSARETSADSNTLLLPNFETNWSTDALNQINSSTIFFKQLFGKDQLGMWPSELAVSPSIIPLLNSTNIKWLVTDQAQLGKIVPELTQIDSSNLTSLQEHLLYQPYLIEDEKTGKQTVTVYRNLDFSDDIGFRYSGRDPYDSASNFVNRFKAIYDRFNESNDNQIKNKPHIVTIALDGENAWENYMYNGQFTANIFLKQLYLELQNAQNEGWLQTITMTQYIDTFGYSDITKIIVKENEWIGSWQEGKLDTWIGEKEENVNWERLAETRAALVQAETDNPSGNYSTAWNILYQAEGSDWFWWAGDDWNSGNDEKFDWIFKLLLRGVYQNIGLTDQEILNNYPYVFAKLKSSLSSNIKDYIDPTIDGKTQLGEWSNAAQFNDSESDPQNMIDSLYAGYDEKGENFFIRIDPSQTANMDDVGFAIYFTSPNTDGFNIFSRYTPNLISSDPLGIEINYEIAINLSNSAIKLSSLSKATGNQSWNFIKTIQEVAFEDIIEISIPFSDLNIFPTDTFQLNVIAANGTPYLTKDIAPNYGSWRFSAPTGSLSGNIIFEIFDEEGDDSKVNPSNDGSKSDLLYPTNSIFNPGYGHFDLLRYTVADDDLNNNVIFQMEFFQLIVNFGWNTPTFTLPYIQIYVDTDNVPGSGRTDSIENARVSIEENHAWDFMINVEGEVDFHYVLFSNGTKIKQGVTAVGDLITKSVTTLISKNIIGSPSQDWNYAVIVGSKDFHTFRNINANPQEWIGGGGSDGNYDSNVYDMLTPDGKSQKDLLNKYSELEQKYAVVFMVGPTIVYEKDTFAPNVTITSPQQNQIFTGSGSKIQLEIEFIADDNVGIVLYQVFLNQFLVTSIRDTDLTKISILWYTNGNYNIRINVFDEENNFGYDNVSITINGLTETEKNPFLEEIFPSLEQAGTDGFEAFYIVSTFFLISLIFINKRRIKK